MVVMFLTAIAAGPVLLLLVLNLAANQAEKARELRLPVAGREHAPALIAFLERQQVAVVPAAAGFEDRIRGGELDVVLEIDPAFGAGGSGQGQSRSECHLHVEVARATGHARRSSAPSCCARSAANGDADASCCAASPQKSACPFVIDARDLATPPTGLTSCPLPGGIVHGLSPAVMRRRRSSAERRRRRRDARALKNNCNLNLSLSTRAHRGK